MPKYKITYGDGINHHDKGEEDVIEAESLEEAEKIAWEVCNEACEDQRWSAAELIEESED